MEASHPTVKKSTKRRMYLKPVETRPSKRRRTRQLNSFYTIDPSI